MDSSETVADYYFYGGRPSPSGGIVATGFSTGAGPFNEHQDLWVMKTNCAGFDSLPQADFSYSKDSSKGIAFEDSSLYATERYWSFGDGYFSNLKDPDHTYPDTSAYSVTLVASACGRSDTVTKVVEPQLVKDTSTSLAEQEAGTVGIEVRPNPNDGRFRVRYQLPEEGARMMLYSMKGRQMLDRELQGLKGRLRVRKGDLQDGLYMLRVRSDKGKDILSKKLVVR